MIRINLLSEGRRPVVARTAKPKISFGAQDPSLVILIAGLVIGLLVAGGWWWKLKSETDSWDQKIRQAEAELKELDKYVKKVEEFKRKQAALNTKIEVIERLSANQRGPVHVMDEVSKALPDLLWLNDLGIKGQKVDLGGTAFNTNAVAQLIENLNAVEWFAEPESGAINKEASGLYNFKLSFVFSTAELLRLQGADTSKLEETDDSGGDSEL